MAALYADMFGPGRAYRKGGGVSAMCGQFIAAAGRAAHDDVAAAVQLVRVWNMAARIADDWRYVTPANAADRLSSWCAGGCCTTVRRGVDPVAARTAANLTDDEADMLADWRAQRNGMRVAS